MARTTEERLVILETDAKHNQAILHEIQEDIKALPAKIEENVNRYVQIKVYEHTRECRKEKKAELDVAKKGSSIIEKIFLGLMSVGAVIGAAVYAYITGRGV